MKKLFICVTVFFTAAFFKTASANTVSKNKDGHDGQPKWGIAGQHAEYYYLPEIDAYYYVPRKQFIYQSGSGYWTFSSSLPAAHKGYNLYSANKVVINEAGAYRYYAEHKAKYGSSQSNASVQKDQPASKKNKSTNSEKTSV